MRLRWKISALIAAIAVFAIGAFVGTSLGDGGSSYSRAVTVTPDHVTPVGKLVSASAAGRGPAIRHFTAASFRTVAPGDADLVALKCPRTFPNPVTGGAFTSGPGLAIMNLSRRNPLGGAAAARTEYIAVGNVTTGNQSWKPEVSCGKHIKP